eukprot:g3339.t1
MWSFVIPVSLALIIAAISNYAPLHLPSPYDSHDIEKNPVWSHPGPLAGNLSVNHELEKGLNLFENKIVAPESVIFDNEGTMYLFTEKGIFTAAPSGDGFHDPVLLVDTEGGRPLSGDFDSEGNLYFCDVMLGLGIVDVEKKSYEILISNDRIHLCDDLVVSSKGDIYIADAAGFNVQSPDTLLTTIHFSIAHGGTKARILKYTSSTKQLTTLMSNLTSIGGLELSPDESYLLVDDGATVKILKHWLKGPREGSTETFIDNLPGYPDNIHAGSNSTYWVAIISIIGLTNRIVLSSRLLRWVSTLIPAHITMKMLPVHGLIIQVDDAGNVLKSFHDMSGKFGMTTSAIERNRKLYIGSFNNAVKVINLETAAS